MYRGRWLTRGLAKGQGEDWLRACARSSWALVTAGSVSACLGWRQHGIRDENHQPLRKSPRSGAPGDVLKIENRNRVACAVHQSCFDIVIFAGLLRFERLRFEWDLAAFVPRGVRVRVLTRDERNFVWRVTILASLFRGPRWGRGNRVQYHRPTNRRRTLAACKSRSNRFVVDDSWYAKYRIRESEKPRIAHQVIYPIILVYLVYFVHSREKIGQDFSSLKENGLFFSFSVFYYISFLLSSFSSFDFRLVINGKELYVTDWCSC